MTNCGNHPDNTMNIMNESTCVCCAPDGNRNCVMCLKSLETDRYGKAVPSKSDTYPTLLLSFQSDGRYSQPFCNSVCLKKFIKMAREGSDRFRWAHIECYACGDKVDRYTIGKLGYDDTRLHYSMIFCEKRECIDRVMSSTEHSRYCDQCGEYKSKEKFRMEAYVFCSKHCRKKFKKKNFRRVC